jgi:hypothetical protein
MVPSPRRREDPLPQPSYSVLGGTPIHSVPRQDRVLGSVRPDPTSRRRPSVQLVPRFQRLVIRSPRRPTRSTSALFRGGPLGPISGRLYDTTAGGAITCAAFPSPFGAPAFACWTVLFPLRDSASLTVGLPALGWTATGLPRCTRMRPDRGGRLLDPGAMVSTRREGNVPAGIRRFPAASPTPPPKQPSAGARQSRGINEGSPYSPVRSSSRPWPPVMRGGPSAFPQAPHPAVTSDACQGEDRPPDTGPRSRSRHQPHLQPTRSTHNVRPRVALPPCGVPV